MTDLATRLAALPPEKRARFDQLLRDSGQAENAFPISVMQQGIWFLEQLTPHNPAYIIPVAVHIQGELNIAVLRAAANEVVRRHESLRTTFRLRDGKPMQVVGDRMTIDLPETDLRGTVLTADELDRAISGALGGPFDLAAGPLLRLTLLHLADGEYVLVVAMHHLISDGWSVGILVTELSALYEAFLAGRPSPLPELRIQYGDFAAWQHQQLDQKSLTQDLAYWRTHLAGASAALALATDRPRPAVQSFHGASLPFDLPAAPLTALTTLAKQHGATAYMALLAIFSILLHRYSTQDDIVVGVPMANRGRAEIEPLIGFFVNTLPVRTDLSGDPSFADVLQRVRDGCLGAYAHQAIPFEKIVADIRPVRDLSRPPIFQVSLSYQSDPLPTQTMAGVELRRLPLRSDGARFDLELQLLDHNGGLGGWLEYDRDLFDESTIIRIAEHFRRLVTLTVAQPHTPVDQLALLDETERRQILIDGNATDREWPGKGWVHECIEEWAARTPTAEALRFDGATITYGRLNRRANQLARRLRQAGTGSGVMVGVCLDRSFELVVSVLAILKAGAAYVPLDPSLPQPRLDFMVADAGVTIVLGEHGPSRWPDAIEAWSTADLDDDLRDEPDDDLRIAVGAEDSAYVIYTSGSTGEPKGVRNVHGGIRNRLLWMQDKFTLSPQDRVLQKTPFSFDVSVWELLWPLMAGATMVLARPGGHRDSHYLAEIIRAERVTTLHFVPSMLAIFVQEPALASCASLRQVFCSGEALSRDLQDRFFARCNAELHNLYGPTEAAVDVTWWTCHRDDDHRAVPIGYPIANTQMYVLDRFRQPVPAGVPGEIYIGGRGVAAGYVNRAALTAERFVADPFRSAPHGYLFRTGDIGRYRDDGAIDFLGRSDHQVKLRGFRIELGEIEAALTAHIHVRDAIVVAREYTPGDLRLIAYLTGDEQLSTTEVAADLRQWLPPHMVPSTFVVLPSLPLTANGKVDRAALPDPELGRPELTTTFVAPRDDLERSIVSVWRTVLGVEQVGTRDNFFDLGGHSLLMFDLRTGLQDIVGRDLSIVELFQYPTVASLADYLSGPDSTDAPLLDAHERAASRRASQTQRQESAARRAHSRNGR